MGYAIIQIKDANGHYVDWDGRLVALPDGTLGSVSVKNIIEAATVRAEGIDVNVPAAQTVTVATVTVPVGKAYRIVGYGLSPETTALDYFQVKQDAAVKSKIYVNTYEGGIVPDNLLIDNRQGTAPVVVVLQAHNGDALQAHLASGFLVGADVSNKLEA